MSTIEEIIKIERETASQLEAAKKEAESIKNEARNEASVIIDTAKTDCKSQTEDIFNKVKVRTAEEEKKTLEKLNEKLSNRKQLFNQQCDKVADWIVEQIII